VGVACWHFVWIPETQRDDLPGFGMESRLLRYKKNLGVACIKTPEQIATELRLRFASAVLQSPACRDVTITNEPLGERNLKDYENGWSLSFNAGIDGGDIDYSNSEWQIIDNKTKKRFGEGPMKDAVEAAARICTLQLAVGVLFRIEST
jgi:hypothetical protein